MYSLSYFTRFDITFSNNFAIIISTYSSLESSHLFSSNLFSGGFGYHSWIRMGYLTFVAHNYSKYLHCISLIPFYPNVLPISTMIYFDRLPFILLHYSYHYTHLLLSFATSVAPLHLYLNPHTFISAIVFQSGLYLSPNTGLPYAWSMQTQNWL